MYYIICGDYLPGIYIYIYVKMYTMVHLICAIYCMSIIHKAVNIL